MLTIEEYKKKYPEAHCWGSFQNSYNHGARFITEGLLQFTEETAHNWAGPFHGGYAQFVVWDYTDAVFLHGKDKGKKVLETWAQGEQERKSKTERSIFPDKKIYHPHNDMPTLKHPVRLYIVGNDDTSYSKFYRNEQEAMEELNLFIMDEPLDFKVIYDFKFIFTN